MAEPALAAPYDKGDLLVWHFPELVDPPPARPHPPVGFKLPDHFELRNSTTLRPVVFDCVVNDADARVRFGLDHHIVPLAQLRRPAAHPYGRHPATPIPGWAVVDLAPLRLVLRQRHDEARTAGQFAAEAAAAADRADEELQAAQHALAHFAVHEQADADRTTEALRTGKPIPRPNNAARTAQRDAAARRCTAAKAAASKLTAELAEARGQLREAEANTAVAARAVLSGIAHREGAVLAALEVEAARRRAELLALSEFWPPATPPSALMLSLNLTNLLSSPPAQIVNPVGVMVRIDVVTARQKPYRALYERLAGGDAEADIEIPAASVAG